MGGRSRGGREIQGWEGDPGVGEGSRGGRGIQGWERDPGVGEGSRGGRGTHGWEGDPGVGGGSRGGRGTQGWEGGPGVGGGPSARTVVIEECMVGSCHEHMLLHSQGLPWEINLYLEVVLSTEQDHKSISSVCMHMY